MSFLLQAIFGKKEREYVNFYHFVVGNATTKWFPDWKLVAAFEDTMEFCNTCPPHSRHGGSYKEEMSRSLLAGWPLYLKAKSRELEKGRMSEN